MVHDDHGNGRRILVAEDDLFLRRVYGEMLRLAGYDTISAAGPEDCLRALRRSRPDVVILDLDLVLARRNLLRQIIQLDRNLPVLLNAAGSDRTQDPDVGRPGPHVFRVSALGPMLRLIRWLTSDDSPARRQPPRAAAMAQWSTIGS
jgi:CheY-like chemotaxis protein